MEFKTQCHYCFSLHSLKVGKTLSSKMLHTSVYPTADTPDLIFCVKVALKHFRFSFLFELRHERGNLSLPCVVGVIVVPMRGW